MSLEAVGFYKGLCSVELGVFARENAFKGVIFSQ